MNDEDFVSLIHAALDDKLFADERELGQAFGVCRAQIERWKAGTSLPMPGARKVVASVIARKRAVG